MISIVLNILVKNHSRKKKTHTHTHKKNYTSRNLTTSTRLLEDFEVNKQGKKTKLHFPSVNFCFNKVLKENKDFFLKKNKGLAMDA